MRARHFLFLLLAGLLIAPTLLWSQGPPGPMQGKGGPDLDAWFNRLSNGADAIKISALTDFRQQNMARKMAEQAGVTGDDLTREQFKTGFQNMGPALGGGRRQRGGQPTTPGEAPQLPGGPVAPIHGGDPRLEAEAHQYFTAMDVDHDNFVTQAEAMGSARLRDPIAFNLYDVDKDGKLSFDEYKVFYTAQRNIQAALDPNNARHPEPIEEEQRPTIYRAGKLPKELPPWFGEIDKKGDNDGQIGMDEWVKFSNKELNEFQSMDLNSDGVLTAEEYLKFHKHQEEAAKLNPLGSPTIGGQLNPMDMGGRPGNWRQGGGFGGGGPAGPGGGFVPPGGFPGGGPADNPRGNGKSRRSRGPQPQ